MSKAFTSEDSFPDDDEGELPPQGLPAGEKNYITPAGAQRMREELQQLLHVERPKVTETVAWAAGNGDRSENADYQYGKRRLREIDRRIHFLRKRIDAFVIVNPAVDRGDSIFFGATVTVADEEGRQKRYSIVGADEGDIALGRISWLSPLGAALLKAKVGEYVQYRTPKGVLEVEVVRVEYVALE